MVNTKAGTTKVQATKVQATTTPKQIKKPNINFCGLKVSQCNKKLQPTKEVDFLIWNILAIETCPYATELCKRSCYARKSEKMYKATFARNQDNTNASKESDFVGNMTTLISSELIKSNYNKKTVLYRIHESGDFYNYEYFVKWVNIAENFKGNNSIIFQAYTKSLPYIMQYLKETGKTLVDINIHFTFSIWDDTKKEYIANAKKLDMQTYEAFDKKILAEKVETQNYFKCECVACGECKECYKGQYKKIAIAIH